MPICTAICERSTTKRLGVFALAGRPQKFFRRIFLSKNFQPAAQALHSPGPRDVPGWSRSLTYRRPCRSPAFPARRRGRSRRPALRSPGGPLIVGMPRGRLDPSACSASALEPSEGEQDERYDERTDRVLDGDVIGARLEPREKRGKATRRNEPVHGGDGKEQNAKKSGDQRQGSVHRADVSEDREFSVTAPSVRCTRARREGRRSGGSPGTPTFRPLLLPLRYLRSASVAERPPSHR
jgi:hypothetical protein